MTSATDKTGCLSHRPNTHFFVMFEDFLDVAKVSEHQYKLAAFWRVMETKTNDRISYNEKVIEDAKKQGIPEPETNLWIEIPYSEFVKRACGVFKASSFQVAAAESERLGFSESRIRKRPRNPLDPDSPLEEYKEYRFNTEGMQSVLNGGEYPTPVEINSPLLNSIATRKKKRAVENNTTPIDFNSTPIKNNKGRRKTPIKNNSTPLLKSIGNNISPVSSSEYEKDGEDTYTEHEQNDDDSGSALAPPTLAPAPSQEISPDDNRADAQNTNEQAQLSTKHVDKTPPQSGKDVPEKPNGKDKGRGNTASSKPTPPEFTPEGQKVYDAWCSLFKSAPRQGEKTINCANDLYSRLVPWCQELRISCRDLLKEIKNWLYKTDPDWYRRKGVTLCDIGSRFESWQSVKTEEMSPPTPAATTPGPSSAPINYTQKRLEAARQQNARV